MEKDFKIDMDIYVEDSLRSFGCLFPETDEQMTIYEKTIKLKELPTKFQRPNFVFNKVQRNNKARICSDVDRTILAGHIINMCNTEDFGRVKFQKLLYLVEHVFQLDMHSNYQRKAAGPYDRTMINQIELKLQQYNFFRIPQNHTDNKRVYYIPISGADTLSELFHKNFSQEHGRIDKFLSQFNQLSWEQCEIIATLYAVWNNRIIAARPITDDLLKSDFLAWDPHKSKYKNRLDTALQWMRSKSLIPIGWGKIID